MTSINISPLTNSSPLAPLSLAIVGATGAVGRELLTLLEERNFPVRHLQLFASARSKGQEIVWKTNKYESRVLERGCFEGVDLVFFDASDKISLEWVPEAARAGAWVIDNSGAFRLDSDILLLVPEVNGSKLSQHLQVLRKQKESQTLPPALTQIEKNKSQSSPQAPVSHASWRSRVFTGPNCAAAPAVMVLKPMDDRWDVQRVVISTYQSTSGAGSAAMDELKSQTQAALSHRPREGKIFPHPIAFNCIPQIGQFAEEGYTSEEQKIIAETKKILNRPHLRMTATAVRVPTLSCHALSMNVEFSKPFSLAEVREALEAHPGLQVQDDVSRQIYPLAVVSDPPQNEFKSQASGQASDQESESLLINSHPKAEAASGKDAVYVGRIRRDLSVESGLNLWILADNLRKGAALNAIQLGELLIRTLAPMKRES